LRRPSARITSQPGELAVRAAELLHQLVDLTLLRLAQLEAELQGMQSPQMAAPIRMLAGETEANTDIRESVVLARALVKARIEREEVNG
jgi:hypothetical protein